MKTLFSKHLQPRTIASLYIVCVSGGGCKKYTFCSLVKIMKKMDNFFTLLYNVLHYHVFQVTFRGRIPCDHVDLSQGEGKCRSRWPPEGNWEQTIKISIIGMDVKMQSHLHFQQFV